MIAVDVMGGDHAPRAIVQGALRAARSGIAVGLFGDQVLITRELQSIDTSWAQLPITLVHCADMIEMADIPTRAVLKQRDASMVRALRAVVDGQATAVVTAGNSGAALVAGMLIFDRVSGLERPALGRFLPTKRGDVLCLDLGVNADCKPEHLVHFAFMGQAYMRVDRGILMPRIGLLSNGHEPYKGSTLVKKAYELLAALPLQFVGNVEAREIFDDRADVIICDGFTGNILLKTAQGTAKTVAYWLEQESSKTIFRRLCMQLFGTSLVKKLHEKTDYAHQAGALLLGLNHPLIVAHGCASDRAIERSVLEAHRLVSCGFVPTFNDELIRLLPIAPSHTVYTAARTTSYQ